MWVKNKPPEKPQVLVHASFYQGSILNSRCSFFGRSIDLPVDWQGWFSGGGGSGCLRHQLGNPFRGCSFFDNHTQLSNSRGHFSILSRDPSFQKTNSKPQGKRLVFQKRMGNQPYNNSKPEHQTFPRPCLELASAMSFFSSSPTAATVGDFWGSPWVETMGQPSRQPSPRLDEPPQG